MTFMDTKKQISFKPMISVPLFTFLVLILSPLIATALSSQFPEKSPLELEIISQQALQLTSKKAPKQTLKNLTAYGPVNKNEGLWDIAEKIRLKLNSSTGLPAKTEITNPQIAVALFDKNPNAFIKQNINGLLIGSTLKVPELPQIQKLTKADAYDLFIQHWDVWQGVKSEIIRPKQITINELTTENYEPEQITSQLSNEAISITDTEKTIENVTQTMPITPTIAPAILEPAPINHPATKQKADKVDNSVMNQVQNSNFHQNFVGAINWFESNLNLSNIDKKNITEQFSSTSVKIALVSLLFIIFLIWLSKREEAEVMEIKTNQANKEKPSLDDKNTILTQSSVSQNNTLKEGMIPQLENYKSNSSRALILEQATLLEEKESFEEIDVYSGNIFSNQGEKKEQHKSKNMLEAAFADKIMSSCNNFVLENIQTKQKTQAEILGNQFTETLLTDSVDEIRSIHEATKSSKIDAFLDATQVETLCDEMLSHDFDNIINSDKIDVFIQEFEEVMSNLSSHAPEVTRTPNDLDNLLQYKLSIHFIKMLSEMMQATYLKQFSTTIIEFLEDVLDGKTKMTTDTTNRLLIVVSFYSHYIHSIKKQNIGNLEA